MAGTSAQIDLSKYRNEDTDFAHLSLKDLVTARDLYHMYLMRHSNVVATAVGRYRIRKRTVGRTTRRNTTALA
jgi:hypothetical protein